MDYVNKNCGHTEFITEFVFLNFSSPSSGIIRALISMMKLFAKIVVLSRSLSLWKTLHLRCLAGFWYTNASQQNKQIFLAKQQLSYLKFYSCLQWIRTLIILTFILAQCCLTGRDDLENNDLFQFAASIFKFWFIQMVIFIFLFYLPKLNFFPKGGRQKNKLNLIISTEKSLTY